MKTNYRHCEEQAQRVTKQSNKKLGAVVKALGLDWIASSSAYACATARLLAMTSFLIIITTPGAACFDWLATWRNHSGGLPNGSRLITSGTNGAWSVTANFGGGAQIIHGETVCIGARCYCRRTVMERAAVTNYSPSVRGNRQHRCTGTLSTSCVGSWFFIADHSWTGAPCANFCPDYCSSCVLYNTLGICSRTTVLQ